MKFLKDLKQHLKRKEGGTKVGNLLRKISGAATGGVLGRGSLMIKEGETKEENKAAFIQALGSAAAAYNTSVPQANASLIDEPKEVGIFKAGYIKQTLKNIIPLAIGIPVAILSIFGIVKLIKYLRKK